MARSIVTSGDIECQNCFLFLLVLRVRFAQKYASNLRRYFCSFYCFWSSMIVELKSSTSRFYCDFVRVQQKRKNYAQVSATSSNVFTNYLWAVLTFVLINFVFVLTKRENVLNVFKCVIATNSNKKRLNVRNCRWRVKTLERVFPQTCMAGECTVQLGVLGRIFVSVQALSGVNDLTTRYT